uniref:Ribosomal protein S12 n=1 Tax=Dendrobium chrysotoxum TaxID=161865 RepID=A0A0S2GMA2_DENCH|nr:ribosomal protein S12 [Dendrobium chrysotoxum]ALN98160.1 ribosomal protein S12 [Dendrobium chrysotoxum]
MPTIKQLIRNARQPIRNVTKSPALRGCPQRRGTCTRVRFSLPLSVSTNNSKYLDFFRTGPSPIAMIRSTSFSITLFRKPKDSIVWISKSKTCRRIDSSSSY